MMRVVGVEIAEIPRGKASRVRPRRPRFLAACEDCRLPQESVAISTPQISTIVLFLLYFFSNFESVRLERKSNDSRIHQL